MLLALISLASALAGRFLLPFLGFSPKAGLMSFISGLAAVMLAWQVYIALYALKTNCSMERELSGHFPQSVQELRAIGVETELDFIQTVRVYLVYTAAPYIAGVPPKYRTVDLPDLFNRSTAMFEEMFGRKPDGYLSGDWLIISEKEVFRAFGRKMADVPEEEFQSRLSEKLKDHFDLND